MKNIVLFDTSAATMNHGDEIIMESFMNNAKDLLDGNFVAKFPTHTPCFNFYQQTKHNPRYRFVREADHKFICGTNIINNKMHIPWPFWNINLFNSRCYQNAVLVGVGITAFPKDSDRVSLYSKMLFSSFLSKEYKHSVRDERTKRIVEAICGKDSAINTGCPTLWGLTPEHCREIPAQKAPNVVFTLTDYSMNREADEALIEILLRNYETVYYWPQGARDIPYFQSLKNSERVQQVAPGVAAYRKLLTETDIDYVGTRLHSGIYAMQHKVRSIILVVDNRAADIAETYNINTISRDDPALEAKIREQFCTDVKLDLNSIEQWKSQFREQRVYNGGNQYVRIQE